MYDAIIVGARCAGSPTALLLARKGYRVLVVDRTTFPEDTLSTHIIWPPGVARLKRWGLLDRVAASNCPREFTCQLAALEPPPPDFQELLDKLRGTQAGTNRFFGALAGTVPIPEFFSQSA